MKKVEEGAYKRIPFEILSHVTDFCENNDIRYSLYHGTLLGAIRHKGYIPWDDDIDIVMPRKDYEKFRKDYNSDKYPLIDLLSDDHYPIGVSKVYDPKTFYYFHNIFKRDIGLFIDVFVLDNVPDCIRTRNKWLRKILWLKRLNTWKNTKLHEFLQSSINWKWKVVIVLSRLLPISSHFLHIKIDALMRKYESTECNFIGCPIDIRSHNNAFVCPKSYFEDYVKIDFENNKFMATSHYDEVLQILYGDYMRLPPEHERVGKHGLTAYYK